ncbi:MAG TPA: phosphoribosylanthranilate isomerase [Roseiflexaceae bacterium]|nr:phosphoribosylanthranilate isomerase [Roseiflexaceae bacterium]
MIKICGLRTAEHARAAADCGADMLGLMLAPSRRQVSVSEVAQMRDALERRFAGGAWRPQLVGVFVNADQQAIRAAVTQGGLDAVQLSGDEGLEWASILAGLALLKAVRLNGGQHEAAWLADGPHHQYVRLLIDAHVPGSYGGTGVTGDWAKAAALASRHPIILAGGLTPENVGTAIATVQPWGVDVSSGVETDGSKDPGKIQAFIAAARRAFDQVAAVQGGVNA